MKVLFYTREYPPYVYGGAGVHVEYLAGELSRLMDVEVRCFGDQDSEGDQLRVKGFTYDHPAMAEASKTLKPVLNTLMTCMDIKRNSIS